MFTGIVCGLGTVTSIQEYEQLRTIQVRLPEGACDNLTIGASIANNGCCLTITAIKGDEVCFDVMAESLAKTNLGQLKTPLIIVLSGLISLKVQPLISLLKVLSG